MWQEAVVAMLVAAAALHAAARYLPAAWRQQVVYALSRKGFRQERLARVFNTQSSCGDGCSSCGSCESGNAGTSGDTPNAPAAHGAPRRVIRLHIRKT